MKTLLRIVLALVALIILVGVIAYAEVNPDYTRRPEPSDVFRVLDALHARAAA